MRLVIVEDEIRIREGLIHLLDRLSRGIEVVGVAENGAEGLKIVTEHRPDLIITDIRMPQMDGLKMLGTLHEQQIPYKAIVLSAYTEFAYAQQAIKLGVSEYLIKPIAADELLQALKNIEAQIQHEQSLKAQSPQQFKTLKNIFYSILLGSTVADEELCTFVQATHRLDPRGTYAILAVYLGEEFPQNIQYTKNELGRLLEGASFGCSVVEHPHGSELLAVLYNLSDPSGVEKYLQHLIITQAGIIAEHDVAFGWTAFAGLELMREHAAKLRKNMDWCIIFGKKALISYPAVENIRYESLPYPVELESRMKAEICSFKYDKLKETFRSFLKYLKSRVFCPAEVKETMIRFVWSVISVIKEIDYSVSAQMEQQALMEKITMAITEKELEKPLAMLSEALGNARQEEATGLIVRKAKSMVHECYNQGITLDEIAGKLNITPEYLGSLFHREVGETFSSYIKNYRIRKAKGLLIGTDMKIYDISTAVGYADSKYFSRVFREITGQLPADFRKLNR